MPKEFSTFMDGQDCQECDYYEKQLKKKTERVLELERVITQFLYFMDHQESGHYFSKDGNIYLDFKKTMEAK